jgi:hypothetical protein
MESKYYCFVSFVWRAFECIGENRAAVSEPVLSTEIQKKVKVKFTLEQAMKAQRGSSSSASLFL